MIERAKNVLVEVGATWVLWILVALSVLSLAVTLERPVGPLLERLTRGGIAVRRPVFRPIHRALGLGGYPEADRLWTHCLSLPCYPSLTDAEVDAVGAALAEALRT